MMTIYMTKNEAIVLKAVEVVFGLNIDVMSDLFARLGAFEGQSGDNVTTQESAASEDEYVASIVVAAAGYRKAVSVLKSQAEMSAHGSDSDKDQAHDNSGSHQRRLEFL